MEENNLHSSAAVEELQRKKAGVLRRMPAAPAAQGVNPESFLSETVRKLFTEAGALLIVMYDSGQRAPGSEGDFLGKISLCLLPYIEKDKASDFAEELVKSVENLKIHHPMNESSKYITISAGMATIMPDKDTSPTKLLDEADKALYTAKQSGRNRVVVS